MVFDQQGFITTSQIWTESLFRERGVRAILGAHVERVEPGKLFYETLDGDHETPRRSTSRCCCRRSAART